MPCVSTCNPLLGFDFSGVPCVIPCNPSMWFGFNGVPSPKACYSSDDSNFPDCWYCGLKGVIGVTVSVLIGGRVVCFNTLFDTFSKILNLSIMLSTTWFRCL